MADLKINITATDRASPSINKVAQAMQNVAQQSGVLSGSLGKLASQLGGLIGAGGMAGLSVAAVALVSNLEELKHEFADWVTGMGKAGEGLDELDQKTQRYIETLKGLQKQLALTRLEGAARAAAVLGFAQREMKDLEAQVEQRTRAIARLEALRAEQAKGFGVQGIGFVTPGLRATEESLKRAKEELAALSNQLGAARAAAADAAQVLDLKQAEEGEKRVEALNKALKEQERILEELAAANYKNMLQIQEAVDLEQKLFVDWAKDLLEISSETAKVQAEINELGLARLEKSLGTGVTEEAIESGLEKNAATAKKIIEEYREGIARDQAIWIKLQDQRAQVIDKQRQQWERMLESIRQSAGQIFDAMLTKGEGVFSSLAKFAEGVFQTMLRNVFQNAVQGLFTTGAGILSRVGGGAPGGARLQEQIGGGAASTGLGAIFSGLLSGGGGGAAAGATAGYATSGGITYATGAAGSAAAGGGGLLGFLGLGGAGGAVGLGGTLAAGAATAGIATAAILATSYISGLFKAGEQRRLQEQARRAGIIQGQQFAAPETQTRFGIAGGAGYSVETDLTGSIRGIGKTPTVIVNVENSMIDARHAREAGSVIGAEISRQILSGGSLLSDDISWAAS